MALVQFPRNEDALNKARQNDINGNNGNFALSIKSGRTTLRVMPSWNERGVWFHEVMEHFIATKNRSFPCIYKSEGRCPVCEHGASLAAQGQEDLAKEFRVMPKFLANVLVLSEPSGKLSIKDGIKVMKLPITVKKMLLDLDTDISGGYGDITDYYNGFNVNIDRSGQGLGTRYNVKPVPQRVDIIKTIQEEGLNVENFQLIALDSFVPYKSLEELSEEFEAIMRDAPATEATQIVPTVKPVPQTPLVKTTVVPSMPKSNIVISPPVVPTNKV